jgi:hypothetical protein
VKQYYNHLLLANSDSSAAERETSLRELCKINRDAVATALERPPVKDERDGWIVKKGGQFLGLDSEDEKTSAPSVSPDKVDHPFSPFAYDDFMDYKLPKKQQTKRLSGDMASKPSAISPHEEDDDFKLKKRRLHTAPSPVPNVIDITDVDSSARISDFLPSDGKTVSNPVYQTDWSSQNASHRSPAPNAPMHSHLRCVDPNKTWNMITRTTGPTTPLHPSQYPRPHPTPTPSLVSPRHQYPHPVIQSPQAQPKLETTQSGAWSDDLRRFPTSSLAVLILNRKVEANKQRALARLQENRCAHPSLIVDDP